VQFWSHLLLQQLPAARYQACCGAGVDLLWFVYAFAKFTGCNQG